MEAKPGLRGSRWNGRFDINRLSLVSDIATSAVAVVQHWTASQTFCHLRIRAARSREDRWSTDSSRNFTGAFRRERLRHDDCVHCIHSVGFL